MLVKNDIILVYGDNMIESLYQKIINKEIPMTKDICTNYELMKRLCEYKGMYLNYVDESILDVDIVKIAFSHKEPSKVFRIDMFSPFAFALSKNREVMEYLISVNGNYLMCADSSILDIDLLEKALSHPDVSKRFDISVEKFSHVRKSKELMTYLIEKDGHYLQYVNPKIIDEDLIEKALKHEEIKNDASFLEEMFKTFGYEHLRKTKSMQFMLSGICDKYGLDLDVVNYHFERLSRINDEVFKTINFEFLNSKYEKLYMDNGYEKLYILVSYPDVQQEILDILKPINRQTKEIDEDLAKKRLNLLNKMLRCSIRREDDTIVKDWIPYYANIITSFSNNTSFYDRFLKEDITLTDEDIGYLTMYTLGNHKFPISNITNLRNYDLVRERYITNTLNKSTNIIEIKDALFERIYGISYDKAKEIYDPYHKAVEYSPSDFPEVIVDIFNDIKNIMEEKDIRVLRESSYSNSIVIPEYNIITIKSIMKRIIINNFNNNLYSIKANKPSLNLDGIDFYLAAGKDGSDKFSLIIHSLGAYSGFYPDDPLYNFKEDWNKPKISSHGLCTSLIGNNNLGTARVSFAVLGFNNFEENSLLLGANEDIVSSSANVKFDTSSAEMGVGARKSKYFLVDDMLDWTRHTHNEIVFERRVKYNKKRQPSYIVYFCDNFDEIKSKYKDSSLEEHELKVLNYTIRAAKDFKLPIVVVERDKVAKHEHDMMMDALEEFYNLNEYEINENAVDKYIHDILIRFESNHAGCRGYHENIDNKYFSAYVYDHMLSKIKNKIASIQDGSIRKMIITKLEENVVLEKEKFGKRIADSDIDRLARVTKVCSILKEQFGDFEQKSYDPLYVMSFLQGTIKDDQFLSDYKNLSLNSEQLSATEVFEMIDDNLEAKIYDTVSDIYKHSIYASVLGAHSTRHIEDVILFSAIIGKNQNLSSHDMNLLLEAAKYHDCGRINDRNTEHAKIGAVKARKVLSNSYDIEDVNLIANAIAYHEVPDDEATFKKMCISNGIDVSDKDLYARAKQIAYCLKDADAVDRTRFISSSRAFVREHMLRYDISKSLIKVGEQINESYAVSDFLKTVSENSDDSIMLFEALQNNPNPKEVMRSYRKGYLKNKGGKDGRKKG